MEKKKNYRRMNGIVGGIAVVIMAVIMVSCATVKAEPLRDYYVNWIKEQGTLIGKKAVILNIEMPERTPAKGGESFLTDFQFNNNARWVKKDVEALQIEQQMVLTKILTEAYITTFNAEVINADFPYGDENPTLQYFTKPSAETKEKIVFICTSNEADFIIAPVAQIITHDRTGDGYHRFTDITTSLAIFNKDGEMIATGSSHTPSGRIRFHAQLQVEGLREVFETAGENLQELIFALK